MLEKKKTIPKQQPAVQLVMEGRGAGENENVAGREADGINTQRNTKEPGGVLLEALLVASQASLHPPTVPFPRRGSPWSDAQLGPTFSAYSLLLSGKFGVLLQAT